MVVDAPLRVTHSLCLAASIVGSNAATECHCLYPPPGPLAKLAPYGRTPLHESVGCQPNVRSSRTTRGGSLLSDERCSLSPTPARARAPRRDRSAESGVLSLRPVPSRPSR